MWLRLWPARTKELPSPTAALLGKEPRQHPRGSISVWTLGNSFGSGPAFWSGAAAPQPVKAVIIPGPAPVYALRACFGVVTIWKGWPWLEGTQQDLSSVTFPVHPARARLVLLTACSGNHLNKGSEVPVVLIIIIITIIIIKHCILVGLLQVFLPVLSHCYWPTMGSDGTGAPLGVWEGLRMVSPSPCLSFLAKLGEAERCSSSKGVSWSAGERSKRPVPSNNSAPPAPNQQIQLMFNSHTKRTKPSPAWEPTGQTSRTRTAPLLCKSRLLDLFTSPARCQQSVPRCSSVVTKPCTH